MEKFFSSGKQKQVEQIPFTALGVQDTIRFALRNNLMTRLALEQIRESKGQRLQIASELLPHVEAGLYETRVGRMNYAAMGFKSLPLAGPFDTFDARFRLTQKVFDLSAFSRFQAGYTAVKVKEFEEEFARQKVTLEASLAYLVALRSKGEFKAAEADLELAERLLRQAEHQHEAQIATGVDVARATTRRAEGEFVVEQMKMVLTEAYLQLQRVAGLPYDEKLALSDSLDYLEEPEITVQDAVNIAERDRLEARILQDRIRAQNYLVRAAKLEPFPKGVLSGDYGLSGNGPKRNDRATGQIMIGMSMPLLEGGKIWGTIRAESSRKRQLERQMEDLRRQIEEDVRLALLKIRTERQQVKTAKSILDLAQRELKMSRDRFAEGLGDNVEVVGAQATLARARDTYVIALTEYHVARLNLLFALGQTGSFHLKTKDPNEE
ncbi:MAG TPA: TolC family protein [Candidatus Omnitrophota bacterium]|nr:TolC family protein [Candidatus Omnitrophota bacterium]HPS37711.1 TolC family protein [Candidatus Omnitrophota bacterium]